MNNSLAVAVSDLRVTRGGREVLHGIDLSIQRGTITGLIGPSGCGKTTLIRAIVGGQAGITGTVTVLGRPAGSVDLRRSVGYATQTPAVYLDMTVIENLRYFAAVLGVAESQIEEALAEVGLESQAGRLAGRLSTGQLSRVSLAVALLGRAELLVFDEPTVGLDPVLRRDLWEMFHRLVAGGLTMVVSSHVMDEAARCDRLVLMRDGAVIADDTPDGLYRRTGTNDLEHAFLRLVEEGQTIPS
jgi:ABC-2 type transport system ATP-binding protein